jgi:hypothetical protein
MKKSRLHTGVALYPAVDVTEKFSLGLRGEYFKYKEGSGDDSSIFS